MNFNKNIKGITFFILISFLQISHASDREKLEYLKARRDTLQVKTQKAELCKIKLSELQTKIADLEKALEISKKILPKRSEIQTILQQIKEAGTNAGLKFQLFQQGSQVAKTNFIEIPLQFKITCTYNQLIAFLTAVGNLPKIVSISLMKVQLKDIKNVEAEIRASLYIMER